MSLQTLDIFPAQPFGMSSLGFMFGAGTSFYSGYPLMPNLTCIVLNRITSQDYGVLEEYSQKLIGRKIDKDNGEPNIEIISDFLEIAIQNSSENSAEQKKLRGIRESLRKEIIDIFLEIRQPTINHHVRFFNALAKIFMGRPEPIWIFTPNYDLLFELAASISKIQLIDGFVGTSVGYFLVDSLLFHYGSVFGNRFHDFSQPSIRLIKLHGSLDWWECDGCFYRINNIDSFKTTKGRVLVLPKKNKVTETLDPPFDNLFRVSSNIIGTQCKYLVSCGYSFGDQNINDTLLLPKLREAKLNLVALIKNDSTNLNPFKEMPSFSYETATTSRKRNAQEENTGSDLWDFEKFVDLLCGIAGL